MSTATNVARLFLLLGGSLLYLLGQGWLAVGPIVHGGLTARRSGTRLIQELPLALLTGLAFNFLLILTFQSLKISVAVGCVVAFVGLGFFIAYVLRHHRLGALTWRAAAPLLGATAVCLLYLSPILTEPLWGWDARSIWFFHARMIYTAGSIGPAAGWLDPTVAFSHPDYPKLASSLASQVAGVMGFWNEYLPKASLYFMLVPAVLWIFSFARRSLSFLLLLLLLPLGLSSQLPDGLFTWMWNGYMDGFLALYFGVAMLLLGRYIEAAQSIDLASAVCILVTVPNIKNEGALAAVAGLAVAAYLVARTGGLKTAAVIRPEKLKYGMAILAGLIPMAVWAFYKHQWGLPNDLEVGTAASYSRLITRLLDGSLWLILGQLWDVSRGAILLAGVLCCVYVAWNMTLPRQTLPSLLAGSLYGVGIVVIYLVTPHAVEWQLDTSIARVALSFNACLFVASYFSLHHLESDPSVAQARGGVPRRSA